jgi:hypothetical protein
MINQDNLKELLLALCFALTGQRYRKDFANSGAYLAVDFAREELLYPEDQGLTINERQTCTFFVSQNFVVFA